jgi:hypothetical protein
MDTDTIPTASKSVQEMREEEKKQNVVKRVLNALLTVLGVMATMFLLAFMFGAGMTIGTNLAGNFTFPMVA